MSVAVRGIIGTPLEQNSKLLDPLVKYNLQHHLVHNHHRDKAEPLRIGTIEQLKTVAKISKSEIVAACFDVFGRPRSYPDLPKRSYLVACIRWVDVQVFAVYSLEQMRHVEKLRNFSLCKRIEWRVLEISEEFESALLKGVDLEDGITFTSQDASQLQSRL